MDEIGSTPAKPDRNDSTGLAAGRNFYRVMRRQPRELVVSKSPTRRPRPSDATTPPTSRDAVSHTQTTELGDNATNEANFILERSPNGLDSWVGIAQPPANAIAYSDTGLPSPSTQYFYRIRAINPVGPSGDSNVASATTQAAPTLPNAPTGLAASAASTSQINLA